MKDEQSSAGIAAACNKAMNKLCKWRSVFVGWMIGSKHQSEPGVQAYRDAVDFRLAARVELNALSTLLIEKGVFTREEFTAQVTIEAELYDKTLENLFPGYRTTDQGITIDPKIAVETNRRMGFPP